MKQINYTQNYETGARSSGKFNLSGEDAIQAEFCVLLDLLGFVYFSIPNGSNKTPYLRWLFKQTGLKAGVPDLFIAHPVFEERQKSLFVGEPPRFLFGGLFVETKTSKNGLSNDQKVWRTKLTEQGYKHEVCRTIEQLIYALYVCYPTIMLRQKHMLKAYGIDEHKEPETKPVISKAPIQKQTAKVIIQKLKKRGGK